MSKNIRVAYCTGFWCTNIGNGFFSLGVEHVLKKVLGTENVTIVSDYQTYTTGYGKRLYPDKKQLEYIKYLDVDYIVLAGPVLSKYFLMLWEDILNSLRDRGIGYILISAGTMKLDGKSKTDIKSFFEKNPPFILSSRDTNVYNEFGKYAVHSYDGICCSFFVPDMYTASGMSGLGDYIVLNFDKIAEPKIWLDRTDCKNYDRQFKFGDEEYNIAFSKLLTHFMKKTDRFTDAIIYALSILPTSKKPDRIGNYNVIRTDHRFHPHYRRKIYRQNNSFCADIPYGYLNLYANSKLTISDRVHACAVTLAFGNSAMLMVDTNRLGLLGRVGASDITKHPVKLNMDILKNEKEKMIEWLTITLTEE